MSASDIARDALLIALRDEHWNVREEAATTLGKVHAPVLPQAVKRTALGQAGLVTPCPELLGKVVRGIGPSGLGHEEGQVIVRCRIKDGR